MCVEWSACAAAEPADDAAAALHEQKKVASREADAARRRPSRAADATATLRCIWWAMCGTMCDVCWPSGGICAVSGSSRDVRGIGVSMVYMYIYIFIYLFIYLYIHTPIHTYIYTVEAGTPTKPRVNPTDFADRILRTDSLSGV